MLLVRRISFILALAALSVLPVRPAAAQCVSLTTLGSAATQNFDTLSNVAGSTTNNLTIPGWFMTEIRRRRPRQRAVRRRHRRQHYGRHLQLRRGRPAPSARWAACAAAR